MRVLVTGANGFVGKHLVAALVERHHTVYAAMLDHSDTFLKPVTNCFFDITDETQVNEVMERVKPEGIIHLAAQSMVKRAWESPNSTLITNTISTISILECMKKHAPNAKLISIGSSEEYGLAGKTVVPLTEDSGCFPMNPYATSKLAAGQIVLQLAQRDQVQVVHVRPFNHFGPGQREGFVISDFASQVARIEKKIIPPVIRVGDLSASRDFTDVRDVVDAYISLLESNVSLGIYNICSGKPVVVEQILKFLVGQSSVQIEVQKDPSRMRPSDVPQFIGSYEKLNKETGWKPKLLFEDSLLETLKWWRSKV
ncbi:MAG: GDP-mannose 4,6-dehydratase [Clostridia bacterium]|nr:GDP-mannose 4,6-dehydratase [Clostridia bacterium]